MSHAPSQPARSWSDAFSGMPLEPAPADGWQRITARLDARRASRTPLWLATAAALVLAVALPWQLGHRGQVPATPQDSPNATRGNTLATLYAESAQLESLLRVARDDRVSSGAAATIAGELDSRVASIDAALMQSNLSPDQQMSLWRQRVEALRTLTSFESTRRWLAVSGSRYDGALARVD